MRYTIVRKDLIHRREFLRYEKERRRYKIMEQTTLLPRKIRAHYSLKYYFNMITLCRVAKIHNRCILTGRGRSIYRDFRLSRIQIRHLASFGFLMGVKKSSW